MEHFGFPPMFVIMMLMALVFSIWVDFTGHKDGHVMSLKESAAWSGFWIALAVAFGGFIYVFYGAHWASMYFSGYALEKALSIDNLMVFAAIFASFSIKSQVTQHRILLWGIAGAIFFRGVFVSIGTGLFNLHWSFQLIFAGLVGYSAYAMYTAKSKTDDVDYTKHPVCNFVTKLHNLTVSLNKRKGLGWIPVIPASTTELHGDDFFKVIDKVKFVTPVFLCMCVVELSDVMFSFDSVPAVIGVTQEPLLVYSAMLFALLGLRALFFVLLQLMEYLSRLEDAVILLLVFVAAKMAFGAFGLHMGATLSLIIVLATLVGGVVASILYPVKEEA